MHESSVLLPEPDGPMMHITLAAATSRSIPLSTVRMP